MKCPHCATAIHFEEYDVSETFEYSNKDKSRNPGVNGFDIAHGFCPACEELIVMFREGHLAKDDFGKQGLEVQETNILYPKFSSRPVEPEVPGNYRQDFGEATGVLGISPKASAAISRRMLQNILRDDLGVTSSSLSKEIDEFISQKGVPSHLSGAVDAVRNVGNFAAHPLKDTNTGEIVDVEPEEAEWLLDVLEALFDFAFVQPKRLDTRQKQLNAKLAGIGKPKMKGT